MNWIPRDYFDSRERFRKLASAAGGHVVTYPVTSNSSAKDSLSVDSVFLGKEDASNIVVVVCGVHGIEAYAGSACIQYFLQHYQSSYRNDEMSYLIIHALNPWGFANDSRVTEENVDLNRNFTDFSKPRPSGAEYSRFHSILCEDYHPGAAGLVNELRFFSGILNPGKRCNFQQAVTGGQYQYSNGLFYGGNQETQNRKIWERIMRAYLKPEQHIRFLDIHTGLGKKGYGALLTHEPVASSKFKSLNGWLDQQLTSTTQDSSVSAFISGPLPSYVEDSLGNNCHTVTLEFGVSSPLYTLNALRADNWLRTTQDKKAAVLQKVAIKKKVRNAFVKFDPVWERKILDRFAWTINCLRRSFPGNRYQP
jgi:hypothetical protein